MIIGKRTYEVMIENDEFNRSNLNKIKTVVLTNDTSLKIHNSEFVSVASFPQEAISILHKQGFETIMVCGGGGSNASFIKENLIDEIYLDIEPIAFGKGIHLFAESEFENEIKTT
jgi:dihydrofolate reductase